MKRFLNIVFWLFIFVWFSFAQYGVWWLNDIDILSRWERWADEALKYSYQDAYVKMQKQSDEFQKYLSWLKETDFPKYTNILKSQQKTLLINKYLSTNFLDEVSLDKVVTNEDWNNLRWPFKYKYNKTKIVIHHTTNDYSKLTWEDSVKDLLKSIYRYHAISRGRWDIWYNFVIDHYGKIYEWRAWWEWIVWAHDLRNNVDSIWISLIGNFQNQEPTQAQIDSLTKLITSLSKKYSIDPYSIKNYHLEIDTEPYIKNVTNYSIIWHKDAWYTACPWINLYNKIPDIIAQVSKNLKAIKLVSSTNTTTKNSSSMKIVNSTKSFTSFWSLLTIKDKVKIDWFDGKCSSQSDKIKVIRCSYADWYLSLTLEYVWYKASWSKIIYIWSWEKKIWYKVPIIWFKDLDALVAKRKQVYKDTYWLQSATTSMQKIKYKITTEEAKELIKNPIKVLLYEISTKLTSWDIKCEKWCNVNVDWTNYDGIKSVNIGVKDDKLDISIDWKKYNSKTAVSISNDYVLEFINYDRKSYWGNAWNQFRWNIHIKKDNIKILWWTGISNQYVVINEVGFDDYMRWIWEISEKQSLEKIKAMALIIKWYTLFYINNKNPHPSMPTWVSYNAVDDPRIFQKYVWYWAEATFDKWYKALEATKDQIITYNWYLPILPYFHCSWWFTLSWVEKWWWTDTPYLKPKLDLYACEKFSGHWVWLSWEWAEFLAKNWFNYTQIIQYYYDWVNIINY